MTNQEKETLLRNLAERVLGWQIVSMQSVIGDPEPRDTRTLAWWDGEHLNAREYRNGRCVQTIQFDPLDRLERAWMLVEALRSKAMLALCDIDGMWQAKFCGRDGDYMTGESWKACAATAPEAICLAADAATRGEVG